MMSCNHRFTLVFIIAGSYRILNMVETLNTIEEDGKEGRLDCVFTGPPGYQACWRCIIILGLVRELIRLLSEPITSTVIFGFRIT